MGRPGYNGDRNDLDMEYDNYGGQERHEQEGGRRGLSRETAKSMAALDQRQVEGSQRGDLDSRAGGLAHSQSSSDLMRPTGQMGGMSRQGGRVNIFREALKGAAGNKDARVGREEPGPNYEGRGNPTSMHREEGGSRREEFNSGEREGERRRDHLPYSPSREEGGYGRRDAGRDEQKRMGRGKEEYAEEEYEPYDNYGRRGDPGSSGSRRDEWGGREGGRSSQPRSQSTEHGRGWSGASGSR